MTTERDAPQREARAAAVERAEGHGRPDAVAAAPAGEGAVAKDCTCDKSTGEDDGWDVDCPLHGDGTCRTCLGSGEIEQDEYGHTLHVTCYACNGSGHNPHMDAHPPVPPGAAGLLRLLVDLREALRAEPVMNNMKYDGLGIRLNKAIDALKEPGNDAAVVLNARRYEWLRDRHPRHNLFIKDADDRTVRCFGTPMLDAAIDDAIAKEHP